MTVAWSNMAQSKERVRIIVVLLDERMTMLWAILAKPCGWSSGRELLRQSTQRENHSLYRAFPSISSPAMTTTAHAINGS
jgi:hypothetical protein